MIHHHKSLGMDTYRIDRTYDWNYEHGPGLEGVSPSVPETPTKEFLGYEVSSRIGIAAGLLLNSRWIEAYGRLGFDILTYKTVRIKHRDCYALPNWVYIDKEEALDPDDTDEVLRRRETRPTDPTRVTSSVSFGMPSKAPEVWTADVGRARESLGPGQVLVVSIVASPGEGTGADDMIAEFGRLTALARDAGAQVVEANLSCPNVRSAEGSVYADPELSGKVAAAMRHEGGDLPLTLKAGYFHDESSLGDFLRAVAGAVQGVVLVNGVSRRVVNADGSPSFGAGREVAGILGRSIHRPCLENIRMARRIVDTERLDIEPIAVGGTLEPPDAARYFEAGAHAVLMGGAPMFDPLLAVKMKKARPEW